MVMKICLDLRTVGAGRHGIARYGLELTRALQALGTSHRLVLLASMGSGLAGLERGDTEVVRCSFPPYGLSEQLRVPYAVARLEPDLYHCPTYACALFVPVPTLFTIHDLLPLEFPEDFPLRLKLYHRGLVRWMAKRARRILTVSSYSRASIRRHLRVPAGKVRVIPEGGDHAGRESPSREDEHVHEEINPGGLDYFLSVANPRPHKNVLFSLQCLLESEALREKRVRYVLVGQQHPSVHAYVKARDREGRVRFAGEVSDGLLRLLYERAVALLCPSRGEGFCLPAVEAMQFGLPVIAATEGALPEVVGSAGLLLSLGDPAGWRNALEQVLERRHRGDWDPAPVIERARAFAWAKTAESTLALYEEVYRETR